ncbi:ABC transporter permease [Afifella marina]|uniref:Peptide/nickel transport system permease protein n=1 Tax=Afifella marina DSM 2698 TaxID=1120955 RepID=A0A1G5NUC4_AFIMA|nr:ABC transporter permease [Afifella marina]MBK1624093.1 ABC transporter permease [Afifella marina DSM 2698]MBK1627650.1 ABC transporter permease [Afifella marina]MBK5916374.1 ABC transporter permease [Afifella marina]RAI20934.1 ABC transporter permease [Afifella marina DSM 2698]SCZ40956.1 peptide/nickel transport system permease protein [Afifella marina DSM 2698]
MVTSIIRRFIQALFVIVAMTVIVFLAVNVIGNPVDILINPDANQAERARVIAEYGLDQPLWRQYIDFLAGLLRGDFGNSFVYGRSALQVILERFPATLELALSALVIALVVGLPLGLYAGLRPRSVASRIIMSGSILGFSLPTFWVGLMFILLFSVQLGWLPSNGRGETVEILGMRWSFLTEDGLRHLFLPALNLALFKTSLVLRLTRAGVQEVLPQDYIKFARAKGLSERRIISVHVLKNLMIPVVTIVGLEFGSLIAFSVVTESIFAWPGMGKLIIDSINLLDRPVIVAYLMMMVLIFVGLNFIVDLCYTLLDPRVRLDAKR